MVVSMIQLILQLANQPISTFLCQPSVHFCVVCSQVVFTISPVYCWCHYLVFWALHELTIVKGSGCGYKVWPFVIRGSGEGVVIVLQISIV